MADVKIRDGAAVASVALTDEFELDTGVDTHQKATAAQIIAAAFVNTAPTLGWYSPSADLIRTPNSVTIDDDLTVSGGTGITVSAGGITQSISSASFANGLAVRNTNAGTAATMRIVLGNNASAAGATIALGSSTHSTKPNYLDIVNEFAAPLRLSGDGGVTFLTLHGTEAAFGVAVSTTTNFALPAGTTGKSTLRIPHGAAPTSPVDGDVWTTTAGLFVRVNGSTVGPLS